MLAHILLPVFAEVHGIAEGEEQATEPGHGLPDGLLVFLGFDRGLRGSSPPGSIPQHGPNLISILGVVPVEHHAAHRLFRPASAGIANHGVAASLADHVCHQLEIFVRPGIVGVLPNRAFLQAEVKASALNGPGTSAQFP